MKSRRGWFGARQEPLLRVLIVCSGNICRSPTAEAVLRAKLAAAGLGGVVEVDSAGTHGFHVREAPDPRAQTHARRRGYDLSKLRARCVAPSDFERFDLILAMDEGHIDWLRRSAPPAARARIALLLEHAPREDGLREVPDPYYGAAAGFEQVLDLVEAACNGVVQSLRAEIAARNPRDAGAAADGKA